MSLQDNFSFQEIFSAPQTIMQPTHTVPTTQITNSALKQAEKEILSQIKSDLASMAQIVFIDPGFDIYPSDSALWLGLFVEARKTSFELHAKLFYLRGIGVVLVPSKKYGYMIKAVIDPEGKKGFISKEIYNQEKQCLDIYKNEIILLLGELGRKNNNHGVLLL